jgi:uroporphyrinogen-III synthase
VSSPAAKLLAEELSPPIVRVLDANRHAIVMSSGGMLARAATEFGWPILIREVPVVVEHVADNLLDRLASMPPLELVALLVDHRLAKGLPPP